MSNEKRCMILSLTFEECTSEQANAILAAAMTLAGASADLIDAPVKLIACPPDAPKHIRDAATRMYFPQSRPCKCAGCVTQAEADVRGKSTMKPLVVPMTEAGPDYSRMTEEVAALDETIPSTEPAPVPVVNVRGVARGPVS